MKQRCFNPNRQVYPNYGGRGITVSDEWAHFKQFEQWAIANGYKQGLDIDRIDNDGNYEPNNCRFISHKKNCNNRSNCKYISHNGETHTITEWADIYRIRSDTLYKRLKTGMSFENAIMRPVMFSKSKYIYNVFGEELTLDDISNKYNIPISSLTYHLSRKHSDIENVILSLCEDIAND